MTTVPRPRLRRWVRSAIAALAASLAPGQVVAPKQFVGDFLAALLRALFGIMRCILARVLDATAFVLAMVGVCLRYGRRQDPSDGPVPLISQDQWSAGVARLV
jgi:hypothetical protein